MTEISMKPIYTKLAADGSDLPADHPNDGPDKHLAVRVELPNQPAFTVSAYRCADRELDHEQAVAAANKYDA
jgi:hypothetical protein